MGSLRWAFFVLGTRYHTEIFHSLGSTREVDLVGVVGFEPTTSPVRGEPSDQADITLRVCLEDRTPVGVQS